MLIQSKEKAERAAAIATARVNRRIAKNRAQGATASASTGEEGAASSDAAAVRDSLAKVKVGQVVELDKDGRVVSKNARKFAAALSSPQARIAVVVMQAILVIVVIIGCVNGPPTDVNPQRYIEEDSNTRQFTDNLEAEFDGFTGGMTVSLPSSHYVEFHKRGTRQYYIQFFEELMSHQYIVSRGVGLKAGWVMEFEWYFTGPYLNYSRSLDDTPELTHPGVTPCPVYSDPLVTGEWDDEKASATFNISKYLHDEDIGHWALYKKNPMDWYKARTDHWEQYPLDFYQDIFDWYNGTFVGQALSDDPETCEPVISKVPLSDGSRWNYVGPSATMCAVSTLSNVSQRVPWGSNNAAALNDSPYVSDTFSGSQGRPSSSDIGVHWDVAGEKLDAQRGKRVIGIKASILSVSVQYKLSGADDNANAAQWFRDRLKWHKETNPQYWPVSEDDNTFVLGSFFDMTDTQTDIMPTLVEYLVFVTAATTVACMVLIHPVFGFFVGIFLTYISLQVIGCMAILGIGLDIISFIVIAMAISFEVEYCVHISHAFMQTTGTGQERMRQSLETMGFTIFWAFLSTAVQSLVFLYVAQTTPFRMFSLLLFIIVTLAGVAGFIFIPSTLAVLVDYWAFIMKRVEEETLPAAAKAQKNEAPIENPVEKPVEKLVDEAEIVALDEVKAEQASGSGDTKVAEAPAGSSSSNA